MSRVGKALIKIPAGVTTQLVERTFKVKGTLGEHTVIVPDVLDIAQDNTDFVLTPKNQDQVTRSLWGTYNRLLKNAVQGAHDGFKIDLEISGVGFKAAVQNSNLVMQLGFSHDVIFPIPSDIKITSDKPTSLSITGASKQRVGQIAAEIRSKKPPEPYKGKGIRYSDEIVRRKEGKKK